MRVNNFSPTIVKTREVFKIQIGLNVEDRILAYNKDRSHSGEFSGDKARYIAESFGLSRWIKRKTYVYGKWLENTKTIQLEKDGELSEIEYPNW